MLEGVCNRCALCCTLGEFRCMYLKVEGEIGKPEASVCIKYDSRRDGMMIHLMDKKGRVIEGRCWNGSATEEEVIRQHIGKGCSLTIAEGQKGGEG